MERLQSPPYSKPLRELLFTGKRPKSHISLFTGYYAWQKGGDHAYHFPLTTLVLPPWLCPTTFRWPVKNCIILVIDTGYGTEDSYIFDLIKSLFRDGAYCVHVHRHDSFNTYKDVPK